MTRLELIAALRTILACDESIKWLESLTCDSAEECWTSCRRSDWMYWLLCNVDVDVTESVWRELACDSAASVAEIGEALFRAHAPEHAGAITEAIAAGRSGDAERIAASRSAAEAAAESATWSAAQSAAEAASRSDQASGVSRLIPWSTVEAAMVTT